MSTATTLSEYEVLVLNDQGGGAMTISYDVTGTLRAETKHHEPIVLVFDARGNGGGRVCPTITGNHQDRVTDYTALVVSQKITTEITDQPSRATISGQTEQA